MVDTVRTPTRAAVARFGLNARTNRLVDRRMAHMAVEVAVRALRRQGSQG
jgi:hypothetical protein